jgi:hypothetical protein
MMPDPTPDPQIEQMDVDEAIALAEAIEGNARKWLRVLAPLIEALSNDYDSRESDVKGAANWALIAACERAGRICRSDLAGKKGN